MKMHIPYLRNYFEKGRVNVFSGDSLSNKICQVTMFCGFIYLFIYLSEYLSLSAVTLRRDVTMSVVGARRNSCCL